MVHRINSERLPGNMITRTLTMGAFLISAAVTAEKLATNNDRRRFNRKARLLPHIRDEGRPIYIMPGCRADGEYIGEMFEPHLQHIGTTYHEAYADDEFDLEDIKKIELDARSRDLGKAAIVYCSSMGGMKFVKSLADPEYREGFGEIDVLILDSSPAAETDLDSGTRFAMLMSRIIPPSWTVSRMYRSVMRKAANKLSARHSPKITEEQIRGHRLSSANTPLKAVKHQAEFINSQAKLSELHDGELAGAAKRIYYISSAHDHVVNTDTAYEEYNRILGGVIIRLIDHARDENGHADGPENPELIVQLMEGIIPAEDENTSVDVPEEVFEETSRPVVFAREIA